ncbi:MAG: dihydrodipicolinate synthase family protein [Acidimicrobiales bacterium]
MDRRDVNWKGYWCSCPTPFRPGDEALDLDSLRSLLEYYVGCGVHGVLINGTVGEWFAQSDSERRVVAETAIEAVAGRITVVIGCTAYTAREAATFGQHALAAGADGVEVSAPPYSKLFPDELVEYYRDIAALVDGPLMVYNWPHGTNVEIGPDLASRLVDIDTVVALKDSTPDADQFHETTRRIVDRVRVFGPFMTRRGLELLRQVGGDGFIGGGTLFGSADAEFWESLWRGDFAACEEHARRNEELFPLLWLPGGWAGIHGAYQSELKAIMAMLGQPGGTTRRPRLPITNESSLAAIRKILIDADLLSPDQT